MTNSFIALVRKRRAELQKELDALAAAEEAYHASAASTSPGQHHLFTPAQTWVPGPWPHTIKEMVIQSLREVSPRGLTAMEILDQIKERWKPDLRRESLSPQLTRLKIDGHIENDRRLWKLVNEPPNETGAPAGTSAPETGGSGGSLAD